MVYPDNARIRSQLETIYHKSPSVPWRQKLGEFLKQIGAALVYELTRDRKQPCISRYYDIQGNAMWRVYDPVGRTSFTTVSEREVREWLECHHLD